MYNIEFYEKSTGESEIWNFLEELRIKSATSKDARIQYKQIMLYIQLLQNEGTRLPGEITKHIDDGIWELRQVQIEYFIFISIMILMYSYISLGKNPKKHLAER